MKPSLSIIIPALNEEANIAEAVTEVIKVLGVEYEDYELLLFNDGSTDRTGEIMNGLAEKNSRIRVTHNKISQNLGGVYKQGIAIAKYEYTFMVPGDNENPGTALAPVLAALGKADIIIPYTTNSHVRPLSRRIASRCYTILINRLFGHKLKYYNGTAVSRTSDLRSITINTNSFAYQSEVLLKLLKKGKTFIEVGIAIKPPAVSTSKALHLGNLISVGKAVIQLVLEIHIKRQIKTEVPPSI